MMLLFVGSNRSYFEYHKNASRPNWRFDSSDKSRGILMLRLFLYNRMLKNRHFVVNQVSPPLVWAGFFTALRKLRGFPEKEIFCRRTCFHASAFFYTQGYVLPLQALWANVPFDVMFFTNGAKILSGGIFSTYINFKRRGNLFSWKSCPTT